MTTSKLEALRTKLQDAEARETLQIVLDSIGFWDILAERDALRADRDGLVEAMRKIVCKLPKYSFFIDPNGGVRRSLDRSGRWIEFDAVHELFEPVAIDAIATGKHRLQRDDVASQEQPQ